MYLFQFQGCMLHTLQVDSNLKIRFKGTKNQITQWPRAQEANRNYAQSRRHPCIPKVGLVNKGKLHKMGIPPMCFVKKKKSIQSLVKMIGTRTVPWKWQKCDPTNSIFKTCRADCRGTVTRLFLSVVVCFNFFFGEYKLSCFSFLNLGGVWEPDATKSGAFQALQNPLAPQDKAHLIAAPF